MTFIVLDQLSIRIKTACTFIYKKYANSLTNNIFQLNIKAKLGPCESWLVKGGSGSLIIHTTVSSKVAWLEKSNLIKEDATQAATECVNVMFCIHRDLCYPFDLCYSKCWFSTDKIRQRSRV